MITLKWLIILIILFLCIQFPHAIVLSSSDTLKISMSGATSFNNKEPLGFKIEKQANVNFSARRPLSSSTYIYMSIKGKKAFFIPFVEEGYIRWRRNGFSVSGGMFKRRFGKCRLYRSTSVYNPLFESAVLWDVYGVGVTVEKKIKRIVLSGAYTIDINRNRALYLLYKLRYKRFQGIMLGGVRSFLNENENDHIILGSEVFFYHRIFTLHTVFKFDHCTHFYNPESVDIKCGRTLAGFNEMRFRVLPFLDVNVLTYYKNYLKQVNYKSVYYGYVIEFMINKWFGIGEGLEAEIKNEEVTTLPEIFLLLRPIKEHAEIKLGFKTRKEDDVSWLSKWSGSIWLEF